MQFLWCVWYAKADVTCTGSGRFPHPDDTECKTYYFCIYVPWNKNYTYFNYTCPSTSVFNPNTSRCTTDFLCNNTKQNTSSTTIICTAEGRIADPSSNNCSRYIDCVKINLAILPFPNTCPGSSLFNPIKKDCDTSYTCPFHYICSAAGRYPDSSIPGCQNYFMCLQLANGTLVPYTNYTCPSISLFNPNTQKCTTDYTCKT